jgi:ankyrin repeat protein
MGAILKGGRMPTHSEVVRLNLEYYRKQAKALLKTAKAGDANALERLRRYSPKLAADSTDFALNHAQLTIAREQGFASWPRFKTFIEQSQLDFQNLVAAFIDAAVSDGKRAQEILAANPTIAGAGFYVALVLGDHALVKTALAENPALAKGKSGPQNCEPLLYVCFSRYAYEKSPRAHDLAETARILLRHGADPNAVTIPESMPENPLSCIYAAAGLNNNPELALALLEAGANPNDGESVYHSTEHVNLACFKLLLQKGASLESTNALKHMLDREELEGLRLLLDAGADPNETNQQGATALHWAIWRRRSMEAVKMLLDGGADVDARRKDGRTPYAMAVQGGQTELATLLKARGANTELSALDSFIEKFVAADGATRKKLSQDAPKFPLSFESVHLLGDLTQSHHTAAVEALLAAGVPVGSLSEHGGTALHWACWKGYDDIVKLLIEHGAPLAIEDHDFHAPPAGWMHHGVRNCGEGDYAQVARLLIAAGAPMKGCDTPTGNAKFDAILRQHKLIE